MPKPSLREGCSKTSARATTCVERRRRDTAPTLLLSHGHTDGLAVAWRHADAIDANLKFGKLQKQTLSH